MLLKVKLSVLKGLYYILDILSNIKSIHKLIVGEKIYIGAAIISLSMSNTSCKSSNKADDKNIVNNKVDVKCYEIANTSNQSIKKDNIKKDNISSKPIVKSKVSSDVPNIKINEMPVELCYMVGPEPDTVNQNTIIENYTFNFCEQMPEFPGGMDSMRQFIDKNIKYPKDAIEFRISGRVILRFVVDKNGEISDIRIARGIFPSIDEEAIRLIKMMPKWIPGKQNNKNINVWYTLPINFSIPDENGTK